MNKRPEVRLTIMTEQKLTLSLLIVLLNRTKNGTNSSDAGFAENQSRSTFSETTT